MKNCDMKEKAQRVLVTGVSSGIGEQIALALLASGVEVLGWSRTQPSIQHESFSWVSVDLAQSEEINRAFESVEGLDALVNNAGVAVTSRVIDGKREDWERMLQVNVLALAQLSQLAIPLLEKSSVGQIVNVSSMSGHRVPPSGGFYAPTKFAVRAVTESLRWELRALNSKVRVSSISPGFVDTPLLDEYFQGREAQLEALREETKMLSPEVVAAQVMHVLSTPQPFQVGDISMASTDQKV